MLFVEFIVVNFDSHDLYISCLLYVLTVLRFIRSYHYMLWPLLYLYFLTIFRVIRSELYIFWQLHNYTVWSFLYLGDFSGFVEVRNICFYRFYVNGFFPFGKCSKSLVMPCFCVSPFCLFGTVLFMRMYKPINGKKTYNYV